MPLHFDSTFSCCVGDLMPPPAAKPRLGAREAAASLQLPQGTAAWKGKQYFFFTTIFSCPRKSLCSDRDPEGTQLRVRDGASALSRAGGPGRQQRPRRLCFQGVTFQHSSSQAASPSAAVGDPLEGVASPPRSCICKFKYFRVHRKMFRDCLYTQTRVSMAKSFRCPRSPFRHHGKPTQCDTGSGRRSQQHNSGLRRRFYNLQVQINSD